MAARAEIEITASDRKLQAGLSSAQRRFEGFAGAIARKTSDKSLGKMGAGVASAIGNIAGNVAMRGLDLLVDAGRDVFKFEDSLVRLQIASRQTPEFMERFGKSIRKASSETGIGAQDILEGAHAYVSLTGDIEGAAEASAQWARIAQATNSKVTDIAQTAAALKQNLKIDPSEMTAAFAAISEEGKDGAVELRDLATQLTNIAPQWAQFGKGTGLGGLRELVAAAQVAKQGFGGDASQTVTGLDAMLTALVKESKRFRQVGLNVFERDGRSLRNVLEIVKQLAGKKFNPEQLQTLFGRNEAYRAYLQLEKNSGMLDDLIAKSKDASAIERDFATYSQSKAGRIAVAWETAKNKLAEAFTPERIEAFVQALSKAIAGFVALVEGIDKAVTSVTKAVDYLTGKGGNSGTAIDWVRDAITDNSLGGKNKRSQLKEMTGIDLENMTPEQRIKALETAKGRTQEETDIIRAAAATSRPEERDARIERERKRLRGTGASDGGVQGGEGLVGALGAVGLDPDRVAGELRTAVAGAMREELAKNTQDLLSGLARIVQLPGGGAIVEVDGNAVARAQARSTVARARKS